MGGIQLHCWISGAGLSWPIIALCKKLMVETTMAVVIMEVAVTTTTTKEILAAVTMGAETTTMTTTATAPPWKSPKALVRQARKQLCKQPNVSHLWPNCPLSSKALCSSSSSMLVDRRCTAQCLSVNSNMEGK